MFSEYSIELIKQVGAVSFIAILLVKQNGKNYMELLNLTERKLDKLVSKVDDLVHKIDHTYFENDEVAEIFEDIAETHKLKKLKFLIHIWNSCKNTDKDSLKNDILVNFKTITKKEAIRLNRIKSHKFNENLGNKFMKIIKWEEFIDKTFIILTTSENLKDLEEKFFILCDSFLISIRTELKI